MLYVRQVAVDLRQKDGNSKSGETFGQKSYSRDDRLFPVDIDEKFDEWQEVYCPPSVNEESEDDEGAEVGDLPCLGGEEGVLLG